MACLSTQVYLSSITLNKSVYIFIDSGSDCAPYSKFKLRWNDYGLFYFILL